MAWIGLHPMKATFTPFDLIPGVGPIIKIRSGYKLYKAGKAGYRSRFAFGIVEAGKDVALVDYYMSRGGTSSGLPSGSGVHPASIQLARPSAQKTRRAQGIKSRGSSSSRTSRRGGRERLKPWCKIHKRRHWCRYTRR